MSRGSNRIESVRFRFLIKKKKQIVQICWYMPVAIDPRSTPVMRNIPCRVCPAAPEKCFRSVRYPYWRFSYQVLYRCIGFYLSIYLKNFLF